MLLLLYRFSQPLRWMRSLMCFQLHYAAACAIAMQGVRLADVAYFWDAPLHSEHLPWAVTANLALRQTPVR